MGSIYNKCSKIFNAFLFLFSNEILIVRAGIHKMLIRIALINEKSVYSGSALFFYAFLAGKFNEFQIF